MVNDCTSSGQAGNIYMFTKKPGSKGADEKSGCEPMYGRLTANSTRCSFRGVIAASLAFRSPVKYMQTLKHTRASVPGGQPLGHQQSVIYAN